MTDRLTDHEHGKTQSVGARGVEQRGRGPSRWAWVAGAIALAVIAALALWMLNDYSADRESAGSQNQLSLEELSNDLDALLGDTVTVRGEFTGMEDERAFILGEEDGPQAVVLSVDAIDVEADIGDEVKVTGTVRELSDPAYLEEFDITLRDELANFDGRAVIVADTVTEV